ncbi:MAG: hypothetical protein Q8S27_24000 [Hoeflea sp.]|nr:hypothetical protein [Hoeflea sp.]
MTTLITRLFEKPADAKAAADALAAAGFRDKNYDVIAAPGGKKLPAADALAAIKAALSEAGVIPKSAAVYAERISNGNALLVMRAPVGTSYTAKDVLNGFASIDAGVRDELHVPAEPSYAPKKYRASATSLLARDAMILSGRKFLPALTSRDWGPWSKLSKSGPRAGLITDRTTPFSSMLGLPLLSKRNS